jgi:isopenicillin N synthase-like dioxygenase
MSDMGGIPIIDIEPLVVGGEETQSVANEISEACREHGFFYIVGHQVDEDLQSELEQLSREFFAQALNQKLAIRMELGGRAWRGYFPVGREMTSGRPDQKEGIYFGAELPNDHPMVLSKVPLHGPNLFPVTPDMRQCVLEYIDAMTRLGHVLMKGISLSLGLAASYFADRYTSDPLVLFRIFHYPSLAPGAKDAWSVGEHTDYGLLTILRQDNTGGLQIKSGSRWIDAPPVKGSFVCNIGDKLDRMTGGTYRSTPHRLRNSSNQGRLSFPFFFDPNWSSEVKPIDPDQSILDDTADRWDKASVHEFRGTYGDYILRKVSSVFPELAEDQQI